MTASKVVADTIRTSLSPHLTHHYHSARPCIRRIRTRPRTIDCSLRGCVNGPVNPEWHLRPSQNLLLLHLRNSSSTSSSTSSILHSPSIPSRNQIPTDFPSPRPPKGPSQNRTRAPCPPVIPYPPHLPPSTRKSPSTTPTVLRPCRNNRRRPNSRLSTHSA